MPSARPLRFRACSRVCHEREYHRGVLGHDGVRLPYEETVEFLTRSRKPACRYARSDNVCKCVLKREADGLPNDVRRRDRQPQRFQRRKFVQAITPVEESASV